MSNSVNLKYHVEKIKGLKLLFSIQGKLVPNYGKLVPNYGKLVPN